MTTGKTPALTLLNRNVLDLMEARKELEAYTASGDFDDEDEEVSDEEHAQFERLGVDPCDIPEDKGERLSFRIDLLRSVASQEEADNLAAEIES